ncbi:MAG: hypothetical protein ABJP34_01670 [Erythrobacter sp.]
MSDSESQLNRERSLAMLVAVLSGCYERTSEGFKTVKPEEAKSFKCGAMLAEIGMMSQQLGIDRGPTGVEAMSRNQLARMASDGMKNAQLELGIRFEEGIGVERDLGKAKTMYAKAASDSGGTMWIYQPPVGNGTTGQTVPINMGPKIYGLVEAKRRLEALDAAKNR